MIETVEKTGLAIRNFFHADFDQVKELIKEFHGEALSAHGITLDDETLNETLVSFIYPHIGIVAELDGNIVGCIGGIISKSIFNKNQIIAQEAMWYVRKEYRNSTVGLRLLKAFENKCKEHKANLICMISLMNLNVEKVSEFYTKCGYTPMEFHFIKEI